MNILVTGGAGFIGSTLIDRLLDEEHTVTTIDDLSTGHASNLTHLDGHPRFRFFKLDLSRDPLGDAFEHAKPDTVVHLAAQISVRASVADAPRDAEINVMGTIRVLEAARNVGATKVVFASSGGCIYGQPDVSDLPVTEDHPADPHSPYGAAKLAAELYLRSFAHLYGLRWTSLAFANVYGPRQDPAGEAGVVAIFTESMLRGQRCTIFGSGEQSRDFVHVQDVVDGIVRALEQGDGERINIGTGTRLTVNELFELLAQLIGYDDPPIRAAARLGELDHISIDPSRARRLLGWQPRTALVDGLSETIAWTRQP